MISSLFAPETCARSAALLAVLGLAACGGSNSSMEPESIPQMETESFQENEGDNVERETGTGTENIVGFSDAIFPDSRGGISDPNTTIGNPGAATPTGLTGVAVPSAVRVLSYNSANGAIASQAANYDSASLKVTVGGNAYDVASNGTQFSGNIISGGDALTVVQLTDPASMPVAGSATYRGSGDVLYVDQPTGQAFNGTMSARVAANFASGKVSITMSNPEGEIGGRAYNHGGRIRIDGLNISGSEYSSNNATTGSVTGFVGAADLNSGNQRVSARGLFGGAAHDETSAVARIVDAGRGEAILRLNASR